MELDYKIEINELKTIFEIREDNVSIDISDKMKDYDDNIIKVFDLRLFLFWKKIVVLFQTK